MKNRKITFTTIFLALGCFALCKQAQAVSPAPDGCYLGFTTAEGCKALNLLTTGAGNTAVGWYSLFFNTEGNYNTGVGAGTLVLNTRSSNTAVGTGALLLNTTGFANTGVGTNALVHNDTGFLNTAVGESALFANISGDQNTAIGQAALSANVDGNQNTASGQFALISNDHGTDNTATGFQAPGHNTGGAFNVAIGDNTLFNNTSGNSNTAVGSGAGTNATGSGNVYIGDGMAGVAGESNHSYIRNIQNTIVSGGGTDSVSVNLTSGLLGHVSSSRRYKEQIEPMDKASEALYRLKPVTYRFKKEIDSTQGLEYGLIAEDVAQVDPSLAIRDGKGQIESVRYTAINAMLLNEFLKEHRKVQRQQAAITELKSVVEQQQKEFQAAIAEQRREIESVVAHLKEQDAKIQRVNDELEMNGTVRQVVAKRP
jgi:hypothetical protein